MTSHLAVAAVFSAILLVPVTAPFPGQQPRPVVADRTTEALARMTEAEKIHAALYPGLRNGSKLLDLAVSRSIIQDLEPVGARPVRLATVVADLTCQSDAILIGSVTAARSHPTIEGTFLFTDYDMVVQTVVKADTGQETPVGSQVVTTRPGGRMFVEGWPVEATTSSAPLLEVGQAYFLFLRRVDKTGAYRSAGPLGSFEVQRTLATGLVRRPIEDADLALGVPVARLQRFVSQVTSCRRP